MNILFSLGGRYPNCSAGSKRTANYVKILEQAGHNIDILSIYPRFTSRAALLLWNFFYPFIASARTFWHSKSSGVIFIYGFGWVGKFLIITFSRIKRKKTVLEINEYPYSFSGSRRDRYLGIFNSLKRLFINKLVLSFADGFIVISEPLHKYVDRYRSAGSTVIYIPVLVDYDHYQEEVKEPECIKPYFLHSAALNDHKDGIVGVFEAIAKVNGPGRTRVHFYLTSKTTLPQTLMKINRIIRDYDLGDCVHFLDTLDETALLSWQKYCSFAVFNKTDSLQNRYNFATKLGEYLALGIPVIGTSVGEMSEYLVDGYNFIEVPQKSPQSIASAILKIMDDPGFGHRIGNNGREVAKKSFDIKNFYNSLPEFFTALVS